MPAVEEALADPGELVAREAPEEVPGEVDGGADGAPLRSLAEEPLLEVVGEGQDAATACPKARLAAAAACSSSARLSPTSSPTRRSSAISAARLRVSTAYPRCAMRSRDLRASSSLRVAVTVPMEFLPAVSCRRPGLG